MDDRKEFLDLTTCQQYRDISVCASRMDITYRHGTLTQLVLQFGVTIFLQ